MAPNFPAGIWQDLRYGIRSLAKQPTFTAGAILALALGIGATTTIFSVIQNVLLDPYPMYTHVDRMVGIRIQDLSSARGGGRDFLSGSEILDYQAQAASFETIIAGTGEDTLYTTADGTEQFNGGLTTGNTFLVLGVPAFLGRTLTPDDEKPDAPAVFVASYKMWVNRLGMDPGVVGRVFTLNGVPTTLVGVMPPRVSKLAADVWRPVHLSRGDAFTRDHFFRFQALLKPGVTIEQAEAEMNLIARRQAKLYPRNYPPRFTVRVLTFVDSVVGTFQLTLYTMAAAVGLLLLIACANVANLLLSRAAGRQREMAVRSSLGASRWRLVRQLLLESVVLAFLGMIVGCGLSAVGITLLAGAIPEGLIPREAVISLDARVMLFSLAATIATVVLFGLAPALQTVRRDLTSSLRDAGKGTGGGYRGARLSSALVVGEIALSLVLLISAGLLMRNVIRMQTTDLGLDAERLLFLRVPVGSGNQKTAAQQQQFLSRALERIRALPGIESASATAGFPVFGGFGTDVDVAGLPHDDRWQATVELCTDGHFRTLGVRLLQGRDFSSADVGGAREVAIVNRMLVDRYMKGVEPIGRQIRVTIGSPPVSRSFEIVGVVADAKNDGVSNPTRPEVFLPAYAQAVRGYALLARTTGRPSTQIAAVKRQIWAADRSVAISDTNTLVDILRQFAYAEPRLGLYVFGAFAAIGLVLVAIGIYSLIAYTVARQKREIGIRMAIGASRRDVLRMTLGLGLRWIAAGVGLGLAVSLVATRALSNQLTGISPTDPVTFASVIAIVCVSGFAASYIPARRATAVDPNVVLRVE